MSDAVIAGKAAWRRLRDREKSSWEDWMLIAEALVVGRTRAMMTAQRNKPVGTLYVRAIGQWLKQNDLHEINPAERYRAMLCLERREEIETWRAGLDEAKRRKWNYPAAVWAHWCRHTKAKEAADAPRQHDAVTQREADLVFQRSHPTRRTEDERKPIL